MYKKNKKKLHNTIILSSVISATSIQQKVIGLLRTRTPKTLYIQTRFGIHTFGMHYPIDVLILDDDHVVRKIKQNIKPNSIFMWNPMWQHVVELPTGIIERKRIGIEDVISFS